MEGNVCIMMMFKVYYSGSGDGLLMYVVWFIEVVNC